MKPLIRLVRQLKSQPVKLQFSPLTGPLRIIWFLDASYRNNEDGSSQCEEGGDVVGVVTSLVGGVAQAFHGDQVVELSVQLAVQEVEGIEEDRKGQVEVEEEKRLKEVRSWITIKKCDETQDLSQ